MWGALAAAGMQAAGMGKSEGKGETSAPIDVSAATGPVTQRTGGDIVFGKSDSWIWLVALAILALVVLRK